jgi:hypothetical protein
VLKQINFDSGDEVRLVCLDGDILTLHTHEKTLEIYVHVCVRGEKVRLDHSKCHWQDVRKLMNQVSEQPVMLELNNIINIIFQY